MRDVTTTAFTACLVTIALLIALYILAQLAPVVLLLRVIVVGSQSELSAEAKRSSPWFISGGELRSLLPTALLFLAFLAADFGLDHFDVSFPGVNR